MLLFLSSIIFLATREVWGANNITGNSSIFDDRININTNYGHAHAVGNDGSFAGSDTTALGFNAGILYPGNRYTPLASHTSSKSNAYSSGRRPPTAYSQGGVQQYGRYGIKGNVASGYSGGVGQAYTKSQSQQFAIPLGVGGAVILSNLPETPKSADGVAPTNVGGEAAAEKKRPTGESSSSKVTPSSDRLIF